MREAPPKKRGMRKGGNVVNNACSGCCKSRCYLKKGIYIIGNILIYNKRNSSEKRHNYPNRSNQRKGFLLIKLIPFRLWYLQKRAYYRKRCYRNNKRKNISKAFSVYQRYQQGKKHQYTFKNHYFSKYSAKFFIIHILSPEITRKYRKGHRNSYVLSQRPHYLQPLW